MIIVFMGHFETFGFGMSGGFAMTGFMCISFTTMYIAYDQKLDFAVGNDVLHFLFLRLARLLPLYFAVTAQPWK